MRRGLLLTIPILVAIAAGSVAIERSHAPIHPVPKGIQEIAASSTVADELSRISASVHAMSMIKEPCESARLAIAGADAYLDSHPSSAPGFVVLGDALSLANQSCTSTVSARHASTVESARQAAKILDPGLLISPPPTWLGTLYAEAGEDRCARAKDALAGGDAFAARRELRWVHYLSVDMGETLCDPDEVDTLWKKVERADHRKKARVTQTPEEAIRTTERAAIEADVMFLRAVLSRELFEHEKSDPICSQYADDRQMLTMCILADLMGDEPVNPSCAVSGMTSRCTTGHHLLTLDSRGIGWVIVGADSLGDE